MMKNKLLSYGLCLLVISSLFINMIYAQPKESTPVYVNSPIAGVDNDLEEATGERVLWSNYTNMFYIFTHFDYDVVQHSATHPIIGYAFSPDGINFKIVDDFFEDIDVHAIAKWESFDVALSPDNKYVWFAWKVELGTQDDLYILKCELYNNGSIIPLTSNQLVVTGLDGAGRHLEGYIDIELSSEGYPFIAYCTHDAPNYFAFTRWCNNDNGTWILEGTQFFDDLLTWNKADDYYEVSKLLRLENGKMGWAVDFADTIGNNLWHLYVGWYNGLNWLVNDADGLYGDGGAMTVHGYHRTDTTSYNDIVVGTYVTRIGGFQQWICEANEYNTGFVNATTIVGDYPELVGRRSPSIGTDYEGNILITILEHGTDAVNYTYRYSNYTWGPLSQANIVKWYDNNTQTFSWAAFTSAERCDNFLGFTYHDNTYANTELLFDYISFNETMLPEYMTHYNTTLYNGDGTINDGWIFKGDIYTISSYFTGVDIFELNFTDGQHEIRLRLDNSTDRIYVITGERFVLGEIHSNYTRFSDGTQRMNITFIPDINIVDFANTTVYYSLYNELLDLTLEGSTGLIFNIYNLGGLTYYTFLGDGGRTTGGSPFEIYATNGTDNSRARAEQIFRKLQHISFLMEIDMSNEWDGGNGEFDIDAGIAWIDIGLDYRLNGSWVEGLFIRLFVQDADVGHHDLGIDHNWVEWEVELYNYVPSAGVVQNIASQLIYSNHWGYEHENYVPDYYNRTSCQLWVDLWFDRANASTTVAAQVNAYYHGLKEQGASWWFGYGDFIPMISNYDNAKYLDDLYDEGGNVTNCQKFDLIKFFIEVVKVSSVDGDDETWTIRGIEDMHREQAIDRMEGIDEPTFVQTKVLDMPQTGFINAIKSAINGLSSAIWKGAFQFIKLMMGAVGNLMDAIGLGEWWRAFNTAMGNIATYSLNLMDNLQVALINSAILLEQLFEVISTTLTRFILGLTSFLSGILGWYREIVNIFTGGGIWNINIWATLELGDWVGLFINLLPVWWFIRIAESDDIIRTLQGDISFVVMITTGLFHFLSSIIILGATLINLLLGLLPI